MDLSFIFNIAILILSVVVHEFSHGYAAFLLGDKTAYYENRLTINPLRHLDPVGSFFVPLLTYFSGGFIIGWAKPVPFNPYNLRNQRWGEAIVAIAGPLSNIVLALIFGLSIRFLGESGIAPESFFQIASIVVLVNLILAFFNLIPIPPLDGSKILFTLFPLKFQEVRNLLERYSIFLLLLVVFFLWKFLTPLVFIAFSFITGVPTL
jgi:Zn-dependent protease